MNTKVAVSWASLNESQAQIGNEGTTMSSNTTTLEDLESLMKAVDSVSKEPVGKEAWPTPDELVTGMPPVPEFDLGLMPSSLRPLVEDIADRMQVPPEFPAAAAIAALGGVCGRRAIIQPKALDYSWSVVPNLWGAIIGEPGVMKSPIIGAMMKPIRAIETTWREIYKEEFRRYEEAEDTAKLDHSVWKEKYKQARKNNGELPIRPSSETLLPPSERRLWTADVTFEALHELMEKNPAGILVIRDELTGWLASLERQGRESDRAFFLESWNGDSGFTVDRIGRGSVHVENCCASIFGGIQPARLRAYLTNSLADGLSNDGLMQRFQILVWPDTKAKWKYRDVNPNASAMESASGIYQRIAGMDPISPLRLNFDREAQELFISWITELEQEKLRSTELNPMLQEHLAKYRSLMPALALLFSIADNCLENVRLSHAQQAADWCGLLEYHAQRVYSSRSRADRIAASTLGRKILKGWKGDENSFTIRDIYRNDWTGLSTASETRAALLVLESAGWVRPMPTESGPGRPTEIYLINPKIGDADERNRLLAKMAPGS